MANYNTKKIYNKIISDGGANYNSGPFLVLILDYLSGNDNISSVSNGVDINENVVLEETINALSNINISESLNVTDLLDFINNLAVSDNINSEDAISIINNLNINENGYGIELISLATTYFLIDADNILSPLGVLITRDNREEILPTIKNYTEKVPGKHGEYKFKSEIKGKILELTVVTDEGLTPTQKQDLKNLFAQYLSPLNGEKSLTFADDIERQYKVRYSGRINIENYPTWFKFVIPFKMSSPFITGSFENVQIGSGAIENKGNVDAHMIIEIRGLATNPSLTIDGELLSYAGTINTGETLVIDTKKKTAKIGDTNVLDNWGKKFPVLKPETTVEVTASNNIIIKWRESWI